MTDSNSWREQAACIGEETKIFFPENNVTPSLAIARCNTCPVNNACLEYALSNPNEQGVWGGKTRTERDRLREHIGRVASGRKK
ncbi:MAG TPA: WhiB family transcriptional regulator [Candidatus Saccharibacteria bacterium]|nr:WhiB family transcriptional regulator [Candidatus Saccharibacteria bacterium]